MYFKNISERDFLKEIALAIDEHKNGNHTKALDTLKESIELNGILIKALEEVMNQKGLVKFLDENDWAIPEDYFRHIAKQALEGNEPLIP